ncbi:urotensin-related peptide 1 [Symphorus nematophorus]
MLSVALFYLVAVICSARRTHALPLYPDTNLEPQADFIQKLVSEVEDGSNTAEGEQREVNNLYPLLMQHNGGRDSWSKGAKDSAQQEKFANMNRSYRTSPVEDLKEAVLKLAAADKLRSQGFLRSEQNLPKTNKRACFWKYCVTN